MVKKHVLLKKGLVIGILVLFIGISINPSTGTKIEKKSIKPISDNNIYYVGGTGEGNYTKIKYAIAFASDGDTVFVYNDSSPYYENIWINKSINLIGEDKETTIICNERKYYECIYILKDFQKVPVVQNNVW